MNQPLKAKDLIELPGTYEFKVIGESSPEFLAKLSSLVEGIIGFKRLLQVTQRPSAKGKYIAYSLTTQIEVYEEIEKVYLSLKESQLVFKT